MCSALMETHAMNTNLASRHKQNVILKEKKAFHLFNNHVSPSLSFKSFNNKNNHLDELLYRVTHTHTWLHTHTHTRDLWRHNYIVFY